MRALLVSSLLGGCVIPPSLSVSDTDAGVNSPPSILAVRNDQMDLPDTSQWVVTKGVAAGMANVTLLDTDLEDTLYVRFFVDYTIAKPQPARVTCSAPPANPLSAQRSVTCDISPLCVDAAMHNLSLIVFDREPLEAGTPEYQAMPPGGLKASWFYFLQCMDAGST